MNEARHGAIGEADRANPFLASQTPRGGPGSEDSERDSDRRHRCFRGGLDAFKGFFSALPAESGMAFVLIQHLDPTRESLTAELVGAATRMRVAQAEDGMWVEANRVYVIPPNAYLSIRQRTLRLSTPTAPRSLRMAVDFFLSSLATDQQENAIGIILSGAGSDGTLGLKEIKAAGGMTMVQDPATVQHHGMPGSHRPRQCRLRLAARTDG